MEPRACRLNISLWLSMMLVVLLSASVALAETEAHKKYYVPNEYIIHVQPGTSLPTVEQLVDRMGASVVAGLPLADTYHIKLGRNILYRTSSGSSKPVKWVIDYIQPNYVYTVGAIPNDTYWPKLWGMEMINMPKAWDLETGSDEVTVAVIDTGVSPHPDIKDRLIAGYDFVDDDTDPSDEHGHGTHVSGTIAAQGNNEEGVVGVCWDDVKIMPVRVMDADGRGTSADLIDGLAYALEHNANVVNMSIGGYGDDPAQHEKIKQLRNQGVIIVASAMNDATSAPTYPAGFDEVIAVSAVGPSENLAYYSNYGKIDIAAPGGEIYSNADDGIWSTTINIPDDAPDTPGAPTYGYEAWQGTSMACPHVAGAAALLLSSGMSPSKAVDRLLSTARAPQSGKLDPTKYGHGILDVSAALSSASVKILQPGKGSTVSSNPQIKISLFGITASSVKVYLDPRSDENGNPDPTDTAAIISTNVTSGNSIYTINWPMSAGLHTIYVQGDSAMTGQPFSDWAAFTVSAHTFAAGIHLIALPYDFATTSTSGAVTMSALPEDLFRTLDGKLVSFGVPNGTNATLTRWVGRTSSARTNGYFTYPQDVLAWANPQDLMPNPSNMRTDLTWYTGGGIYSGNYGFPAGSGFWIVLPQDAVLNESYTAQLIPSNTAFTMNLFQGWNMFGNPYDKQVSWSTTLFSYRGQVKTLVDAEAAGWVSSTIFSYAQTPTRGYQRVTNRGLLEPYTGYWVYALVGGVSSSDSLVMTILP